MTADAANRIAKLIAAISPYPWPDDGSKHDAWVLALASEHTRDIPDDVALLTVQRMMAEYAPDKITPAQIITTCRTKPVGRRRYPGLSLPPPEDASGVALKPIYFPPDNGKEQFPVQHPDEAERERMREFYARAMLPASIVNRRDLGIRPAHVEKADAWRREQIAKVEGELAAMAKRGDLANMSRDEQRIIEKAERHLDHLRYAPDPWSAKPPKTPLRKTLTDTLTSLGMHMKLKCVGCQKEFTKEDTEGYTVACMEAGRRGDSQPPPRWCAHCTPTTLPSSDDEVPF